EGTFNICTFWLVEALTRAGRHDRSRLEEARLIFERMLGFANHLGLYAEETGHRGEALGNFPQAFTHLALVSAAFNLDRALGPGRGQTGPRSNCCPQRSGSIASTKSNGCDSRAERVSIGLAQHKFVKPLLGRTAGEVDG